MCYIYFYNNEYFSFLRCGVKQISEHEIWKILGNE